MPNKPSKSTRVLVNLILLFLGATLLTFAIWRADSIAITHDEAYTYKHYMQRPLLKIMSYRGPAIPNNHLLNTILAKYSVKIFGLSHFNMRIPNLLFCAVFLWYAGLLAKKLETPFAQVLGFIVLTTHIFFFDFFPLARGYGMGIALLTASIYHFYMFRKLGNGKHCYRTLIYAALAVYANFTFLYPYLALLVCMNLGGIADGIKGSKAWWLINRPILVVSSILALFIFKPLLTISKQLFGGMANFWDDTARTLLWEMMYTNNQHLLNTIALILSLSIVAGFAALISDAFIWPRYKKFFYHEILIWMSITVLGQIVQHHLLGTQYLQGRTALLYAPMYIVFLVFLIDRLSELKSLVITKHAILSFASIILIVNFFTNANTKSTLEWKYDQHSDEVLADIQNNLPNVQTEAISIGVSWVYEPALNFYRESDEAQWLKPINRDAVVDKHPFYLLKPNLDPEIHEKAQNENWKLIKEYSTGMKLYKNPAYFKS